MRAIDYRWLHLTRVADPFDHQQADGGLRDMRFGPIETWFESPAVQRWRLATPTPGKPVRVRWRAEFVVPAPLFQAVGVPWALATDELAERIRAGGITNVVLHEVTKHVDRSRIYLSTNGPVTRTGRGGCALLAPIATTAGIAASHRLERAELPGCYN